MPRIKPHHFDVALKVEVAVEGDLMWKFLQTAPLIPADPVRYPASLKVLLLTRGFYFPCQPFLHKLDIWL